MNIDKKIEDAVKKAMQDINAPVKKDDGPLSPDNVVKEGIMKDMYDDMLDFHRKSSNSRPTKQIRDDYCTRQQNRLMMLSRCKTLTASERIMFDMAKRSLANIQKMQVKA